MNDLYGFQKSLNSALSWPSKVRGNPDFQAVTVKEKSILPTFRPDPDPQGTGLIIRVHPGLPDEETGGSCKTDIDEAAVGIIGMIKPFGKFIILMQPRRIMMP